MITDEKIKQLLQEQIYAIPDFPKKGIIFRDLTPILSHPDVFQIAIDQLYQLSKNVNFDTIVSPESRGFWFGIPLALKTKTRFIPARKPNKLPRPTIKESYDLEYGQNAIEIHAEDLKPGSKVLIIDDLIATSGTIAALGKLVKKANCELVGVICVVGLNDLKGKETISNQFHVPCLTLLDY